MLHTIEHNYITTEYKCLSVVWDLQTHCLNLAWKHFSLFSDHISFHWLHKLSEPSGRLKRWCLRMSKFHFDTQYEKGIKHYQASAFSRLKTNAEAENSITKLDISNIWRTRLQKQLRDDFWRQIREGINERQHVPFHLSGCELLRRTVHSKPVVVIEKFLFVWRIIRKSLDTPEVGKCFTTFANSFIGRL